MVIPSGDLAPMRKHRRGYGRHPSRWPIVLAVLAVAAVAGGTYAVQHRADDAHVSVAPVCAPPSPTAKASTAPAKVTPIRLPAPGQVSLRLFPGNPVAPFMPGPPYG